MHCRHCGSDCKVQPDVPDMPAADFLKAIDSLTPHIDPNKTFIIITGGEALLRDDLEDVGLELYRRGYPWGVVTNGYLLNAQRLESLMEAGMHSITVSLDGLKDEHNWLRQHDGSFVKATDAIQMLAAQDEVLWDVVTCVNPHNIGQLAEFKEYLISIGVRSWRLFSIFPMGRAANDPELQLTDKQYRGILDFIKDCRGNDRRIHVSYACEGFLGEYEQKVRDHLFYCRSGVEVASIRCNGAISGCTSVRSNMDQGNIYTDDLWDVWQNRFEVMRNRSWAKKGQCKSCKVWRYCEGSGLHLYDDNGELLTCHYRRLTANHK
jgi:radical SAM enzyme (rSAM/lipoprotein system)